MNISECMAASRYVLMEGALGERLKREYGLSFHPQVAMASLVRTLRGQRALDALWREYAAIADRCGLPLIATTPTRRANRERMAAAGFSGDLIGENLALLRRVGEGRGSPFFAGGLMGCRGDAYTGAGCLPQEDARSFHSWQAEQFHRFGADFLMAGIMPTLPEAAGMAQAMEDTGLPYLISFTIRRDGCLIDGTRISDAIAYIDRVTQRPPLGYMTNCVHPSILYQALSHPQNRTPLVRRRFLGIQGNTSPLDYAQLDGAADLFTSSPEDFSRQMLALEDLQPMKIFGGCCGTDRRLLDALAGELAARSTHG